MSQKEQEELRQLRCYRATRQEWAWDTKALASRQAAGNQDRWIANPFGVRTKQLGKRAKQLADEASRVGKVFDPREHRDLSPCPVGGCVTPEMQRDYLWGLSHKGKPQSPLEINWREAHVCPFTFRHLDSELTRTEKNPHRFVQCYLTLPAMRSLFEKAGLVVAAPIFRSSRAHTKLGVSYWYPFFSGFAMVQVPARAPGNASWCDPTLGLRWHLTAVARQRLRREVGELPIGKLFDGVERLELVTPWEQKARLISICDGQASVFLLQWILIRRLNAALARCGEDGEIDIAGNLEWVYSAADDGFTEKLMAVGSYGYDLEAVAGLSERSGAFYRRSTLSEDLILLGLADERGMPTPRAVHALTWLKARRAEMNHRVKGQTQGQDDLTSAVCEWLGKGLPLLDEFKLTDESPFGEPQMLSSLCWLLIISACQPQVDAPQNGGLTWKRLESIPIKGSRHLLNELQRFLARFRNLCRVVPEMHVLVRANWISPLRWLFVPLAQGRDLDGVDDQRRVYSGLIVMLEDDLRSQAYFIHGEAAPKGDPVIQRLQGIFPLLHFVSTIEENHVREEYMFDQHLWDFYENTLGHLLHTVMTVRDQVAERLPGNDGKFVSELLNVIAARFPAMPEPAWGKKPVGVRVDLRPIVEEAVRSYNLYHRQTGRLAHAVVASPSLPAEINSTEPWNEEQDRDKGRQRIERSLLLLFLDLLLQRASHENDPIKVYAHIPSDTPDQICIEVFTRTQFDKAFLWESSQQRLDRWPHRRGFFYTFWLAQTHGSVAQAITNTREGGVIRISFRRISS